MMAGSSGMTVPCAVGEGGSGEAESVRADSGVGELEAGGELVGGTSVGEAPACSVDSGGGVHPANIELATIKLPVTEAINFKASRREILPSL